MATDASNNGESSESRISSIKYTFIKSPFFRTIHMNGAWGGVTPQSEIQMGLFTEHHPYPENVTYPVSEDGKLGSEQNREQIDGYVREIEINVIMDLEAAIALQIWLTTRIEQLRDALQNRESP